MDTIHQSGMERGGSTLPPDQLSRISPTHVFVTALRKANTRATIGRHYVNVNI